MSSIDSLDPSLLASRRPRGEPPAPKPGTDQAENTPTTPRTSRQKALHLAAYGAIFLVAVILFLLVKIPDSAVSNFALNLANQNTPLRWQADRVVARVFFLPHLRADKLVLESTTSATAAPIEISELRVYPRLHSLIPWTGRMLPSLSFWANAYGTEFEGAATIGQAGPESLRIEAGSIELAKFPPIANAGLDLKGSLSSLTLDLDAARGDFSKANGSLKAEGKNIVFDPGSFRLPMALPILDLGVLSLDAQAKDGRLTIQKLQLGSPGKDLEIRVQGTVQLNRNIAFSIADLSLQVKPSPRIIQAIQALQGMLQTFGALRPDGFYAMKLSGPLMNMGLPKPDR